MVYRSIILLAVFRERISNLHNCISAATRHTAVLIRVLGESIKNTEDGLSYIKVWKNRITGANTSLILSNQYFKVSLTQSTKGSAAPQVEVCWISSIQAKIKFLHLSHLHANKPNYQLFVLSSWEDASSLCTSSPKFKHPAFGKLWLE